MRIKLDKKPLERLARDVQDLREQFKRCRTHLERLQFLNTDGTFLLDRATSVYQTMAKDTLAHSRDAVEKFLHAGCELTDDLAQELALVGRIHHRYAGSLSVLNDSKAALQHFQLALQIADKLEDSVLSVFAGEHIARMQIYKGHAIDGLVQLEAARAQFDKLQGTASYLEIRMSSSMVAATAYIMTGQLLPAMRELDQFNKFGRLRGKRRSSYNIQHHLAIILIECERYNEAEQLLTTDIAIERTRKTTRNISHNLLRLVQLHCLRGTANEKCEEYIQEARELSQAAKSARGMAAADINEAHYLLETGKFSKAESLLHKLKQDLLGHDRPESQCLTNLLLARVLLKLGRIDEAEVVNAECLDLARRQQYRNFELRAIQTDIEIRETRGDIPALDELHREYKLKRQALLAPQHDPEFIDLEQKIRTELARQQLMLQLAEVENIQDNSHAVKAERERTQQKLISRTIHLGNKNELLLTMQTLIQKHADSIDASVRPAFIEFQTAISQHLDGDNPWEDFDEQFALAYPGFLTNLREQFPRLTITELKVCALMKLQLPSKDICRILRMSQRSIETHRYNIRKKMALNSKLKLSDVLQALN